eukprot:maker-scaffold_10-snap-gene-0.20-mRNA-1 protein AED:0.79 eAED:0.79 QI:0/0/0/0.5/1/1/2/0/164
MKKDPVIFSEQDDEVNFEIIDEGANLDISSEEDIKRLTNILEDKVGSLNLKRPSRSIEKNNVRAFGDSESPTSLSNLNSIECELKEGRSVGVLNQHPLGYEQESFLLKRIQQMLDVGIIEVNPNPTTAMSTLVVPKKGPKNFRMVVDYRPLNDATKKLLILYLN